MKNFLLIISFLFIFNLGLVFSQEELDNQIQDEELLPPAQDWQWVFGEVVYLDFANQEIIVRYQDYETEEQSEMTVKVNEKTIYENVSSFDKIMTYDTVSIDYIVDKESKNIAIKISVEKPEEGQLEENLGLESSE
jgi:hypothetical protein